MFHLTSDYLTIWNVKSFSPQYHNHPPPALDTCTRVTSTRAVSTTWTRPPAPPPTPGRCWGWAGCCPTSPSPPHTPSSSVSTSGWTLLKIYNNCQTKALEIWGQNIEKLPLKTQSFFCLVWVWGKIFLWLIPGRTIWRCLVGKMVLQSPTRPEDYW